MEMRGVRRQGVGRGFTEIMGGDVGEREEVAKKGWQ